MLLKSGNRRGQGTRPRHSIHQWFIGEPTNSWYDGIVHACVDSNGGNFGHILWHFHTSSTIVHVICLTKKLFQIISILYLFVSCACHTTFLRRFNHALLYKSWILVISPTSIEVCPNNPGTSSISNRLNYFFICRLHVCKFVLSLNKK